MRFLSDWMLATWELLTESAVYVFFGLLVAGLLKAFLSPGMVARHLGTGRFSSVLKAALLGIPMPLCSCGVLPAGASLKRQGANNGATTAFLISTPETGVDSIAITYALLGPIMTVARPLAAFATAVVAGFSENLLAKRVESEGTPDLSCPVDGCCEGTDCPEEVHARHHSLGEKLRAGMRMALKELWPELAGWFMFGMLLAGLIAVLVPGDIMERYLGGGWQSMVIMLAVGIPLYICATASTPIAASLILKGVSPGAALVFLLAGPATNVTSLSVLLGVLGKRGAAIYLITIAGMSVICGLALDGVLDATGISIRATLGEAGEMVPEWLQAAGAVLLLAMSVKPVARSLKARLTGRGHARDQADHEHHDDHRAKPPTESPEPATDCSGST
ncbi:MAG: SO_0444 family Cu/Zn efflux transporter [Deltaproteobacteria bacterium]|nr:SO_0444 family Cu/Zn efflux transporter [Deltaproteobacteria bacterium]